MAEPTLPAHAPSDAPRSDSPNTLAAGVNTPDIPTSGGTAKRRAITSVEQINGIIDALEEARRAQNEKNAKIAAKYNSERPWAPETLKAEGLDYLPNFSSKPFSTAVDKIPSRLTKAVHAARFLTSAQLPSTSEGARRKSKIFREEVTEEIRNWEGWRPLLDEVMTENALYGFTSVSWLDKFSWKPTHFRQDKFFVPDRTGQTADRVQVYIARQELMIHELAEAVEDPRAARDAGWDVKAVVETLNAARPNDPSINEKGGTNLRTYEDAIRESNLASSLQNGAKVVIVNHVFVVEPSKKVSYFLVDALNQRGLLRENLDYYESMSDALVLFSYQQANGLLMGSKGIGREIYELAGAVDRTRCNFVNRLEMAGRLFVTGPENSHTRAKLSVIGDICFIPDGVEVLSSVRIDPAADAFIALDNFLVARLDEIAGGVSPKQISGERVTAAQINTNAMREEEKSETITERALSQIGRLVSVIQKRLCDPQVDDGKAFRERCLARGLSEEDLKELAAKPALRTVSEWTEIESQKIAMFAAGYKGDPRFDQLKLAWHDASAQISPEFANDVVLPVNDPVVASEQTRLQQLENILIAQGGEVPVSPRDAHRVHADICKQVVASLAQGLQDPANPMEQAIVPLESLAKHWAAHYSAAIAAGEAPAEWEEDKATLQGLAEQIGQLKAYVEQKAVLAAGQAPGVPAEAPVAPEAPAV